MGGGKPRSSSSRRKTGRLRESEEISYLEAWITSAEPPSGAKPPTARRDASSVRPASGGAGGGEEYPAYLACERFDELPISQKTKDGLAPKYVVMSDIQRAALPHALCGRDVLGAAKTGSGKTLAFIIPVIEKLYRARWGPEDGVGCIILSPTKDLAGQLFEELKRVGKHHNLSGGLLVGGRKGVDNEKERVNSLNILVCTPGRLLQHMNETANFDCSQLQVLVLDEADRILDHGFRKEVDAIISQLPRIRQTMLFSATQTKSVKDLARVSLKDPEYISVHEESSTATPERLEQFAMIVPLEQKLDILWSFIRKHLKSKILVFLSSVKQVKFVYEAFRKLRPGTPLKFLHGRMKFIVRQAVATEFNESTSVLFTTDVLSRGLDIKDVDWVVQVDCPEDIPQYIHRVGRTARFTSKGKALLMLSPQEEDMLKKLQSVKPKIPIKIRKPKGEQLEKISGMLSSLLVQYPDMQQLAKRAFITYLKSVYLHKDKEVFNLNRYPADSLVAFATSLGLPVTPKIRFVNLKSKHYGSTDTEAVSVDETNYDLEEDELLRPKPTPVKLEAATVEKELGTRITKKKKLKINVHKPSGTRVKFDDEGNVIPPLAVLADVGNSEPVVHSDIVKDRFAKLREEMKQHDREDKIFHSKLLKEKKKLQKVKAKRQRDDSEDEAGSDDSEMDKIPKMASKRKKYFDDSDAEDPDDAVRDTDRKKLDAQEALALKLLESLHK